VAPPVRPSLCRPISLLASRTAPTARHVAARPSNRHASHAAARHASLSLPGAARLCLRRVVSFNAGGLLCSTPPPCLTPLFSSPTAQTELVRRVASSVSTPPPSRAGDGPSSPASPCRALFLLSPNFIARSTAPFPSSRAVRSRSPRAGHRSPPPSSATGPRRGVPAAAVIPSPRRRTKLRAATEHHRRASSSSPERCRCISSHW
jgi:hypothetical protein